MILTNAGSASCFRFRSRHNLKLDDEPVCNLDTVFVVPEDLADSHFLNCDVDLAKMMSSYPRKMKHRVSALLTGMTCLLQTYSHDPAARALELDNTQDDRKFVPTHCGQVVRLFHPQLDVFLATSPSMVSSNSLIVLEDANGFYQPGAAVRLEQPSAYSMWIVEAANPTVGPFMLYDQPIRLRNLATDGYLCPNRVNTAVMAKQIQNWSANGASKRTMASSICRFSRLEENQGDDARIGKQSCVWINFPSIGRGHGMWLRTSGSISSPNLQLDSEFGPTDGFFLYPVGEEDLTAPFQIVSVSHTVREYITLLKQKGFCSETAVQTERIIGILKDLIKLFDKSTEVKSDNASDETTAEDIEDNEKRKHVEREVYKSQSIIRELQLMDDLVQLVDFQVLVDVSVCDLRHICWFCFFIARIPLSRHFLADGLFAARMLGLGRIRKHPRARKGTCCTRNGQREERREYGVNSASKLPQEQPKALNLQSQTWHGHVAGSWALRCCLPDSQPRHQRPGAKWRPPVAID